MKEVRKIAQKVLVLVLDILLFTWQVIRRVLLPTRSRKGNVLSSLLIFSVGLLERIVSFERSILERPVIFTHKYVKQGLIIVVGFLFLLSSIEWTLGPSTDRTASGLPEVVACAPVMAIARTVTPRRPNFSVAVSIGAMVAPDTYIPALKLAGPPLMGRRWLRFGIFRI
jgi:hypothetical protein